MALWRIDGTLFYRYADLRVGFYHYFCTYEPKSYWFRLYESTRAHHEVAVGLLMDKDEEKAVYTDEDLEEIVEAHQHDAEDDAWKLKVRSVGFNHHVDYPCVIILRDYSIQLGELLEFLDEVTLRIKKEFRYGWAAKVELVPGKGEALAVAFPYHTWDGFIYVFPAEMAGLEELDWAVEFALDASFVLYAGRYYHRAAKRVAYRLVKAAARLEKWKWTRFRLPVKWGLTLGKGLSPERICQEL